MNQFNKENVMENMSTGSGPEEWTEGTATAGEIKKPETPVTAAPSKAVVLVNEQGYLDAADFEGRARMAGAFFRSGMVPKSYKSAEQVFVGMEFACQIGLPPLLGLRNIAVINGMPSLWGDLPLGLCMKTGELEVFEEFFFDKDYETISFQNKNLNKEIFGALCRVGRNRSLIETWFTIKDAETAGLLKKEGTWQTYRRRMLQMRARSQALKDNFPDVLSGVSIAEYDFNYLPDAREVQETDIRTNHKGEKHIDPAAEINKTLAAEDGAH